MEGEAKQSDTLNIIGVVSVGLIGALGIYISFVGLQAFYEVEARAVEERRFADGKSDEFRSLQAQQEAEVNSYRWVSTAKGTVTLKIERAMQVVVGEVKKGNAGNLVPALGPHDTPTVPAVFGRPPDNVQMPAPAPARKPAPAGGAGGAAPGTPGATTPGGAPAGKGQAAQPNAAQPANPASNSGGNVP